LVDENTKKEFNSNYVYTVKRHISSPKYFCKFVKKIDDQFGEYNLQIFELIDINNGKFEYAYVTVPGMYISIHNYNIRLLYKNVAIIGIVGKNILTDYETKNPIIQTTKYKYPNADDIISNNKITKEDNINYNDIIADKDKRIKLLEEHERKLYEKIISIDLHKILCFDLDYILNSPLNIKERYSLSKSLKNRLIKKYQPNYFIKYNDQWYNGIWDKDGMFNLGFIPLNELEKWLEKAYMSKANSYGIIPYAPAADWYKKYIEKYANVRLLKKQKDIPFPVAEFSYTTKKINKNTSKKLRKSKEDTKPKYENSLFNFDFS